MGLALASLPDWPAAMNRETALAYTGVAEAQMRAWERDRKVQFLRRGAGGTVLVLRSQLDAALADLFDSAANEDMEV